MKSFRYERDFAVVETTEGKIRGFERDGVLCFRGVRYAVAKRFHAPRKAPRHEDIFDATSFGFVCPLLTRDHPQGELYVAHRFWPQDEDCLNLNIWTPALEGKRPVLVWLHGGGFSFGSAIEQTVLDGDNMARLGDAVVVSVNHRLNILGYFDLSDFGKEYENSGNAGTADLIAALRWIQSNIASFGGDPKNVTLFGQSGGGGKITALLQSPAADGLYAKGFNMSGVLDRLTDEAGSGRDLALAMMRTLKIDSVKEMEKVPCAALAAAYNRLAPRLRRAGKYVGCAPHPNRHYLGDPLVHGFRKETAHIPMLVGTVYGEFTSFAPGPVDKHSLTEKEQRTVLLQYLSAGDEKKLEKVFREAYPERPLLDMLRLDLLFRVPTVRYLKARAALNKRTYAYLFNMDQAIFGGLSPWHCSDIPYVFHNIDRVEYPHGSPEAESVQEDVFQSVMAFARTGSPENGRLPAWPACTAEEENTMIFDAHPRCLTNHDHALLPAAAEMLLPLYGRIMRDISGQPQR